jgi:predicted PurR-regulated permease PerM
MGELEIMNVNSGSMPAKILLYSTAAVILTIGMREISSILTIVFFSIFVALSFIPLVHWFKRKGIPGVLSVILVFLLLALIVSVLGVVIVGASIQIVNQLPNYQTQFAEILEMFSDYLPPTQELTVQSMLGNIASFAISITVSILNGFINAGTMIGIIMVTAGFLLLSAAGDQERAEQKTEEQHLLKSRINLFINGLVDFIVIRTEVNLVVAIGIAVILLIGGIDFAVFWGVMAFFFGYIPYIGFALTAIPPAFFGLLQYGIVGALAVIITISIINALTENVLFPSLAGKGLKLSPTIVFLSLLYWNYVLGAVGILLATPLTMVLKIILETFEETKWMARLMGPTGNGEEGEESGRQEEGI